MSGGGKSNHQFGAKKFTHFNLLAQKIDLKTNLVLYLQNFKNLNFWVFWLAALLVIMLVTEASLFTITKQIRIQEVVLLSTVF